MRSTAIRNYHLFRCVQVPKHGDKSAMAVEDLDVQALKQLKPDEVLIRNSFAGVNFIDTYMRSGLYPKPRPFPFTLGLEGSGAVVGLGDDLKTKDMMLLGQRVAYHRCESGSYASFTVAKRKDVFTVPAGVTDQMAAATMLQGTTAHYLANSCVEGLSKGDVVVVHAAAGGTGLLLSQMCVAKGATVIGTCSTDQKAKLAKEVGKVDHVVTIERDTPTEEWVHKIRDLTSGQVGVRAVFDGVGKATFTGSMNVLKRRGDLISFGNASGAVDPVAPLELAARGSIRLQRPKLFDFMDVESGEAQQRVTDVLTAVGNGQLVQKIHKVYNLDKVVDAHSALEGRQTMGKLLLDCKE